MVEMLQYWLDTTPAACWQQVITNLEQVDLIALASRIKEKYHTEGALCVCVCVFVDVGVSVGVPQSAEQMQGSHLLQSCIVHCR